MWTKSDIPALDTLAIAAQETVLSQEVDGEIVLLNIESGEYFGLNEVGSRIWTLLQEGRLADEILGTLVSEYDVPEVVLKSDVQLFLQQLFSKGIISINEHNPE